MTEYNLFVLEHKTCKKYFGVTVHSLETYWHKVLESEKPTYVAQLVKDDPENFTRTVLKSFGTLEEAVAAQELQVELFKTTDPESGYNIHGGTYDHAEDFTTMGLGMPVWKSAEQRAEFRKMLVDRMPELIGMITHPRDPLAAEDDIVRMFTECWRTLVDCKGWVSQCVAMDGNKVSVYDGIGDNRMAVKTKFAIEAMQFVVYTFSHAICAVTSARSHLFPNDDLVTRCIDFHNWLDRSGTQGSNQQILCRNVDNFRTVQTRPEGTELRILADLSYDMKNAFIRVLESDPNAFNKACRIEDQTYADNGETYRERTSRKALRIKNLQRKNRRNALKTSMFEEIGRQVTKSPA